MPSKKGGDDDAGGTLRPNNRRLEAVSDGFDPFKLENDTYDPSKFYVRSVDKNGHKESFYVTMPPIWHGIVNEIARSDKYPDYRSVQDLVRDALIHRIHYLNTEYQPDDRMKRIVGQEMYLASLDGIRREAELLDQILSDCDNTLDIIRRTEEPSLKRRLIDSAYVQMEDLPEPYKTKMRNLVAKYET